jgi:hypothetical protein
MAPRISLDGGKLCYFSWERTGHVHVLDLESRADVVLTSHFDRTDPNAFPVHAAISPDGTSVLYSWESASGTELRRVDLDRPGEYEVFLPVEPEPGAYYIVLSWIPSDRLLVSQGRAGEHWWTIVDARDRRELWREPFRGTNRGTNQAHLSPDSRFIAYARPSASAGGTEGHDVVLLDVASRIATPLFEGPADETVVAFTPDASHLLTPIALAAAAPISIWRSSTPVSRISNTARSSAAPESTSARALP